MPTVDETAQAMFGMGRMNPMTMIQIFREINSILSMFKSKSGHAAESVYNFTGQHTDIAFVAENGKLNASEIEKIPDKQLRENVQKSFSDAVQDGYLDYDAKTRDFSVTQKGMEHINSDAFMTQFEKDQRGQIASNKAEVKLRGNESDLNVFRFTDSINLPSIASAYPAESERIVKYFKECEKYGFVHISSDGIATPTEKCLAYLEQNPVENFDIEKVSPDNLEKVADSFIERQESSKQREPIPKQKTREAPHHALENTFENVANGAEAAQKTVDFVAGNSSGTDAAADSARMAAQQGANHLRAMAEKKAREQAAKRAAAKAAAQAGAKAAAKTGSTAAAGAASMGIGAAVSVIVDLSAKGANVLTNLNTQNKRPTLQYRS